MGEDRCLRRLNSTCTKCLRHNGPGRTIERQQYPRLVHQFGKLNPPPARPRIPRARRHHVWIIEEFFDDQLPIKNRFSYANDDELDFSARSIPGKVHPYIPSQDAPRSADIAARVDR
jgi:hypothetical protein